MTEKFTELFQWFVDLSPGKAIIAILLSLVIFFGWNNFQTQIEIKELQKERNESNIDCTTKVANANIQNQEKLNKEVKEYQERYDSYRDKVEKDNLERIRLWELKYELVQKKLDEAQNKQSHTEELVRQITNKLK